MRQLSDWGELPWKPGGLSSFPKVDMKECRAVIEQSYPLIFPNTHHAHIIMIHNNNKFENAKSRKQGQVTMSTYSLMQWQRCILNIIIHTWFGMSLAMCAILLTRKSSQVLRIEWLAQWEFNSLERTVSQSHCTSCCSDKAMYLNKAFFCTVKRWGCIFKIKGLQVREMIMCQ